MISVAIFINLVLSLSNPQLFFEFNWLIVLNILTAEIGQKYIKEDTRFDR